jgi:hypothetical protein
MGARTAGSTSESDPLPADAGTAITIAAITIAARRIGSARKRAWGHGKEAAMG